MKKIIFTILLIAFCSFNLFAQSIVTKEEYEIYATVFEKHFENSRSVGFVFSIAILQDTTGVDLKKSLNDKRVSDYFYSMFLSAQLKRMDLEDLVENFEETNKDSVKLEKQIPTEYEYSLVTKGEIEALIEENRKENAEYYKKCSPCMPSPYTWQPFHGKYRNLLGYYSLSRVGFSKDKKFALFYISGEELGQRAWGFYVLNKVNDKWEIYKGFWDGWVK